MTREDIEQLNIVEPYCFESDREEQWYNVGLKHGLDIADTNSKSPWIKFTEKYPPKQEPIIITMKNKNKEDGIWLYDLCMFFGGDYTDNKNWENKINWEIPIYWMPIPNLPKKTENRELKCKRIYNNMIYIKRILWLIGLFPICFIIALWFIFEFVTIPLKIFVMFLIKGRVDDIEIEWFSVLIKPFMDYLYIDLTNKEN